LTTGKLKRELGFRDLTLFYVVAGLSLRWIATAAATGPSALGVWLLAWCGFFLPLAGCVLELSSRYPAEGGLYVWTREAYGAFPAFMSAWTYWMSNLPYFPAVLFFAASSLLYASHGMQHLGDSHAYFMIFTVVMLAVITVLNVVGLSTGKWLNNPGCSRDSITGGPAHRARHALVRKIWLCHTFHTERAPAPRRHKEPYIFVYHLFCLWRL